MNFSQELGLFRSHNLCVLPEWSLCVHTQWDMAIKLWTHHPSWLTHQCGGQSVSKNPFFIDPQSFVYASNFWIFDSDMIFFCLSIFSRETEIPLCWPKPKIEQIHATIVDIIWITRCQVARSKVLQSWLLFPNGVKLVQVDHANLIWWQIKGPKSCTQRVIWSTLAVGSSP